MDLRVAAEAIERARVWAARGHQPQGLPPTAARMVAVARVVGAPVEPVLAIAAEVTAEQAAGSAELNRVVRPAVAVARGLALLPVVLVPLLAWTLEVDLWAFVIADQVGRVVGLAVLVLLVAAAAWMWVLVRSATRGSSGDRAGAGPSLLAGAVLVLGSIAVTPMAAALLAGMVLGIARLQRRTSPAAGLPANVVQEAADLVAVACAAGASVPAALRRAGTVLDVPAAGVLSGIALRLELAGGVQATRESEDPAEPQVQLERLCRDLVASGAPATAPMRRLARRVRADELAQRRLQVARLPAQLTFPTALLLVPAIVLAVGAPVAVRGLASVTG